MKQPLLFIDTNIFLDAYRAQGEAGLKWLEHVKSVSESLILTDQVEAEFLKNRQGVIKTAHKAMTIAGMPELPAYLKESKVAKALRRNSEQTRKLVESVKAKITDILDNPSKYDPVYRTAKAIFNCDNSFNLKFVGSEILDEIMEAALLRFQRGFPPRKSDDVALGDAINWEWILMCAEESKRNVVIVSRDSDYGIAMDNRIYINDWLQAEFRDCAPRQKIEVSKSLTQSLKSLKVPVTKAEEIAEEDLVKHDVFEKLSPWGPPEITQSLKLPDYWNEFLTSINGKDPALASELGKAIGFEIAVGTAIFTYPRIFVQRAEAVVKTEASKGLILSTLRQMGKSVTFVDVVEDLLPYMKFLLEADVKNAQIEPIGPS